MSLIKTSAGIARRSILKGGAAALCLPALSGRARADFDRASFDPAVDPTEGRAVIFEDGFAELDPAVWHAGPKTGTGDPGFYGRAAFSRIDGEEGFNPYLIIDDPETENGKALQISAKYIGEEMDVPNYYGNRDPEFQWISGNIQTARSDGTVLRGWRRGYFEARMWFPTHPLTWPAFWLMNANSILKPERTIELDVVEHKGFEPDIYGAYVHEWGGEDEHHDGIGVPTGVDVRQGYHRYGILIEGDICVVYFDRQPIRDPRGRPVVWTIGRSAEMDAEDDVFWVLLTLALLPDYPFPDPLRQEDQLTHLRIDYFRVYA